MEDFQRRRSNIYIYNYVKLCSALKGREMETRISLEAAGIDVSGFVLGPPSSFQGQNRIQVNLPLRRPCFVGGGDGFAFRVEELI